MSHRRTLLSSIAAVGALVVSASTAHADPPLAATANAGVTTTTTVPPATGGQTVVIVQQGEPPIKSSGLVIGGAVMVGVGSLGTLIGIPVLAFGAAANDVCNSASEIDSSIDTSCPGGIIAGSIMTVLSLGLVGGGIAMIVIGNEPAEPAAVGQPRAASYAPTVQIGAGSAALSWEF
jgi:hypothetical protein